MLRPCVLALWLVCALRYECRLLGEDLLVETLNGMVSGVSKVTTSGSKVNAFYGIPYAQPPLGKRRFRKPEPVTTWDGVLQATTPPNACMQRVVPFFKYIKELSYFIPSTGLSEDCLKLNIFVPESAHRADNVPVMVFIHGGGFSFGGSTSPLANGANVAAQGDIIVVTINYRLSALGFLYLNHPDVEPNAGMYDQLLAMKWVKNNIEYFGGDPEAITILAHSAGAGTFGYLLMANVKDRYFKRVIFMSGSHNCPWASSTKEQMEETSLKLANFCGCTGNTSEVVSCLQETDASEIVASEPLESYFRFIIFQPVVDGDLIVKNPLNRTQLRNIPIDVEFLIGHTWREGRVFALTTLPFLFPFQKTFQPTVTLKDFPAVVDAMLRHKDNRTKQMIQQYYENHIKKNDRSSVIEWSEYLLGDSQFACPANAIADALNERGHTVYKYVYVHNNSLSSFNKWADSGHGDALIYLLGLPLNETAGYTKEEQQLSRQYIEYFSNFVRTGDPNKSKIDTPDDGNWVQYTTENPNYFVIGVNATMVHTQYRDKVCHFWNSILPISEELFKGL